MAALSKNGKYLTATFNVWYDARADNVHLTTSDKDFGPNGAHLTAKKGTSSDVNFRIGLAKFGCPYDVDSANKYGMKSAAVEALSQLTTAEIKQLTAQVLKDREAALPHKFFKSLGDPKACSVCGEGADAIQHE